jgi:hypothetical protein
MDSRKQRSGKRRAYLHCNVGYNHLMANYKTENTGWGYFKHKNIIGIEFRYIAVKQITAAKIWLKLTKYETSNLEALRKIYHLHKQFITVCVSQLYLVHFDGAVDIRFYLTQTIICQSNTPLLCVTLYSRQRPFLFVQWYSTFVSSLLCFQFKNTFPLYQRHINENGIEILMLKWIDFQ